MWIPQGVWSPFIICSQGKAKLTIKLIYIYAFGTLPSVDERYLGSPVISALKSWQSYKPVWASLWAEAYMWYLLNNTRSPSFQYVISICLFCYLNLSREDQGVPIIRKKPFWEPFVQFLVLRYYVNTRMGKFLSWYV